MTRLTMLTIFGFVLLGLVAPRESQAQSGATSSVGASKQDNVIEELLGEVRQLRMALQHISVNSYRGQVMIERLRLQQEQVNRLAQELGSIRNQLGEMKSTRITVKSKLEAAEKQQDLGVESAMETARYKEVLEDLNRREQGLSEREIQVSAVLETERTALTDLNKRLDALELEMTMAGQADEPKGRVKR